MATKKSSSTSAKNAQDTKPVKTTKNTKTAKSTKTTKSTKTPKTVSIFGKKQDKHALAYIIGAVAAAALLVISIIALATSIGNNGKNSLTVKDGDGNKVTTEYLGFDDFNFRLKIPTSFHSMSTDDIVKKYGNDNAPKTVYANADDTVTIAITPTTSTITNDQVKTYLDTAKSVFNLGGEVLDDNLFTQGKHNLATLKLITDGTDGKNYNELLFFSQNDKLTMITFTCTSSARAKWQPVGEFILKSIDFTK